MKEPMIAVAEALRAGARLRPRAAGRGEVPLEEAFGRTLSRDRRRARTQPPFANSAMDGYALRAADAAEAPARLKLIGESAAGRAFAGAIGAGEAVRIFTGAPIPDGADAVAIQEDARREGDDVIISASAAGRQHAARRHRLRRGRSRCCRRGRVSTPRAVALAAAAHHPRLHVRRRPRVAILATGDELVAPGEPIGPSQIVASNNFFIAGLVEACGGAPVDLGIAIDEPEALAAKIRARARRPTPTCW